MLQQIIVHYVFQINVLAISRHFQGGLVDFPAQDNGDAVVMLVKH